LLCPLRSFTLETSIAVFQGRLAALKGGAEKNQTLVAFPGAQARYFRAMAQFQKLAEALLIPYLYRVQSTGVLWAQLGLLLLT
jgi:hypothetical protein